MANKELVINNPTMNLEQKTIRLLGCVAQEFQAKYIKALAPLGLSPLQTNILHVLDYGPKEGLTVNQIKKLQIEESPNISRALNKLMDKGFIIKNRNSPDQRVVQIQITEDGRVLHEKADELTASLLQLDLSENEMETLYGILRRL
ncbi:MarR family transcriptional regulator [Halosquirtibacter xylanolyticus]|uniref:MarR family winged helix-turn-helix transcriptional regulator n=1 Tax=Halosquirtibacter xylanolyticus TaxID=3374599 RepID=UPI0037489DCE|nr:MarR family transcriptional regulator [Prolixibacteraceae bacterium]